MEKKKIKLTLSVEVETSSPIEIIEGAIKRGIYRGLDTPPYYIAPPKDVVITFDVIKPFTYEWWTLVGKKAYNIAENCVGRSYMWRVAEYCRCRAESKLLNK